METRKMFRNKLISGMEISGNLIKDIHDEPIRFDMKFLSSSISNVFIIFMSVSLGRVNFFFTNSQNLLSPSGSVELSTEMSSGSSGFGSVSYATCKLIKTLSHCFSDRNITLSLSRNGTHCNLEEVH